MIRLFRELFDFLGVLGTQTGGAVEDAVRDASQSVIRLTKQILWISFGVFLVTLCVSGLLKMNGFIPFVIILVYAPIIVVLVTSANAMRTAGLLIGTDVVFDIVRAATPLTQERLSNVATLNIEWSRLKQLATLQLYGRFLFNIVVLELLALVLFSIVGVWHRPGLIGMLIVSGGLYTLVRSPYGRQSAFAKFAGLALALFITTLLLMTLPALMIDFMSEKDAGLWQRWVYPTGSALLWYYLVGGAVFSTVLTVGNGDTSSSVSKGGASAATALKAVVGLIVVLIAGSWLIAGVGWMIENARPENSQDTRPSVVQESSGPNVIQPVKAGELPVRWQTVGAFSLKADSDWQDTAIILEPNDCVSFELAGWNGQILVEVGEDHGQLAVENGGQITPIHKGTLKMKVFNVKSDKDSACSVIVRKRVVG